VFTKNSEISPLGHSALHPTCCQQQSTEHAGSCKRNFAHEEKRGFGKSEKLE